MDPVIQRTRLEESYVELVSFWKSFTVNEEEVRTRVPVSQTRRVQIELNHKIGLNPYDLWIFCHFA